MRTRTSVRTNRSSASKLAIAAVAALAIGCTNGATASVPVAEPSGCSPRTEGCELLGTTPPEWQLEGWLNGPARSLADMRGKVVLARWFMGTSCPMCSATAPTLRALDATYRDKGLAVIGIYHHKDEAPLRDDTAVGYARDYGFVFPVAVDRDFKTLKAWWGLDRSFTSVTFVLDKHGRVRHIHRGGTIAKDGPEHRAIAKVVEKLLAEP